MLLNIKKEKGNIVADAMSRRHFLLSMLETQMIGFDCLKEMYENCENFSKDGFYRYKGYFFKKNKLCVPVFY